MQFGELLETVGDLPLFRSSLLLAGDRDPSDVRRQLSRWTASGKILQLRRNLYLLARPWRRVDPHPFLVANELHTPSYVGLQSALAYHGLIPEAVPVTTSITSGRPMQFDTPVGRFVHRHIHPTVFFGYRRTPVFRDQNALVADPAKSLLDLAYLTPQGDTIEHLESLRLEALESISEHDLSSHVHRWDKPKIYRAGKNILGMKAASVAGATP
ncbi:MAG: hypothetical protein GEU79_03880 [Acidimicrobiia bacterium]|nr:hypothetical protein [Acidimicrobiia bacterium]